MEGEPALVEGENKGWKLGGRSAVNDFANRSLPFVRYAEVVLGDRQ
jgi:hypothetical protein